MNKKHLKSAIVIVLAFISYSCTPRPEKPIHDYLDISLKENKIPDAINIDSRLTEEE